MRKTLHDYIIAKEAECATPAGINVKKFYQDVIKHAKLTNRQPSLGDFVPTDEDGNVLKKPDIHSLDHSIAVAIHQEYQQALDRVIFKGDWECEVINRNGSIRVQDTLTGNRVVFHRGYTTAKGVGIVSKIEDLPREIEFKEGVI